MGQLCCGGCFSFLKFVRKKGKHQGSRNSQDINGYISADSPRLERILITKSGRCKQKHGRRRSVVFENPALLTLSSEEFDSS